MSTTDPGRNKGAAKMPPASGAGGRGTPKDKGGGNKTGDASAKTKTASPPASRRLSPSFIGFGTIGLVVLIVLVLVLVKVTSGTSSPSSTTTASKSSPTSSSSSASSPTSSEPGDTPAESTVVSQVTSVPASVAKAVGVPSSLTPPAVLKGQQPFILQGKPGAFLLTGEFCPYCAAERWAVVMAFSKFGTFSGLEETRSSAFDVDPSTATFSFYQTTYTSNLIGFQPVEVASNVITSSGTPKALENPTELENALWEGYSEEFNVAQGFPFLDIDNKVFAISPGYDPKVLSGLDQSQIAARLDNPADPVAQAIVGSANYLTAAICSVTGQQPASVCRAAGTRAAASALKLG